MKIASPLKRIDYLVGTTVLASIGLVWLVLVGLDALKILLGQISDVGKGGYTLGTAMVYVAWTVPRRMVEMFGWAAAIGGLLGLGSMAPTAEITAMRAGGMSKLRICASAAIGVSVLLVVVVLIGETLAPFGETRAQALAAGAKSRELIAVGKTGHWAREGQSIINAKRGQVVKQGVELFDVRIFDFADDGNLRQLVMAKSALHSGGQWTLKTVSHYRFSEDDVKPTYEDQATWASQLDPRLLSLSIVKAQYLAVRDLSKSISYMNRNGLDAHEFESAFWARMFYPLDVLALAFASLPFAFGALRSGGFGKRLFLGVVLAVGWYFFQKAAVNVAEVYGLDFRVAHLLPLTLLGALSYSYFRRTT